MQYHEYIAEVYQRIAPYIKKTPILTSSYFSQKTGSHGLNEKFNVKTVSFGIYEIKVKLTSSNEFVDILEVKVNKDFLSHKQKIASKGFHDVEKYYRD